MHLDVSKAEAMFQHENFRTGPLHIHRRDKESKTNSVSSAM